MEIPQLKLNHPACWYGRLWLSALLWPAEFSSYQARWENDEIIYKILFLWLDLADPVWRNSLTNVVCVMWDYLVTGPAHHQTRVKEEQQYSRCHGCKPAYRGMLLQTPKRATNLHPPPGEINVVFQGYWFPMKDLNVEKQFYQSASLPNCLFARCFGRDWKIQSLASSSQPKIIWQWLDIFFWSKNCQASFKILMTEGWVCTFIVLWWLYFAKKVTNITFVQAVQSQHLQSCLQRRVIKGTYTSVSAILLAPKF